LLDFQQAFGSMLAGPVVLRGSSGNQDHIYAVVFNGSSSRLIHLTVARDARGVLGLYEGRPLQLPWAGKPAGLAAESEGSQSSKLVLTFQSGWLAVVTAGAAPAVSARKNLGAGLTPPYWCHCPSNTDLLGVGVGGASGGLHVLDVSLTREWTYLSEVAAINATPTADAGGDWFFGAADGLLYELLPVPALTLAARFGYQTSAVQSSPLIGACPAGSCIYLAKLNGTAYLVPLVDREIKMTACISTQPPACAEVNPRLWAHVTVGSTTNPSSGTSPQTVRMLGFSYYSR
jgi:hypothetical protein